jgi:hypothetical protein
MAGAHTYARFTRALIPQTAQVDGMTDFQLYLAIGVPSFAVLLGIIMNGLLFQALNSRMTALETRFTALEASVNTRFDLLMSKLAETASGRATHIPASHAR